MPEHINKIQLAQLENLLDDNLRSWEGEENSVKEEHADLIARLKSLDLSKVFYVPKPIPPLHKMVCGTCGSEDVLADAFASWNKDTQEWELHATYDKGAFCNACEGETRIEEELIDDSSVDTELHPGGNESQG